jgi:hypothetical protein
LVENRSLTDPAEIEQALGFGEYIKNGTHVHTQSNVTSQNLHLLYIAMDGMATIETLALYTLRKYRYLKQRYDSTGGDS